MILYKIDKEKATYYLKRVMRKSPGQYGFLAHEVLDELTGFKFTDKMDHSEVDLGDGNISVRMNPMGFSG